MSAPSRRQVGKVRDPGPEPTVLALADVAGRFVALELAEMAGEDELLLVGQRLVVKNEDAMVVHACVDRGDVWRG